MGQDDDLHLTYYVVTYLDLLGQSARVRQLDHLPKSAEEQRQVVGVLRDTVLVVKNLREVFAESFDRDAPSAEAVEQLPQEHREKFKELYSLAPRFRGFSDSVVITVPLAGTTQIQHLAALIAVHKTLAAVSGVVLNFFATLGVAIRGGIELGLGVEIFDREYYGPALAEAYLLESQMADYPRVIAGPRLMQYLSSFEESSNSFGDLSALALSIVHDCRDLLLADPVDGLFVVDPLGMIGDVDNPHYADLQDLGAKMMGKATEESSRFRVAGNDKLALRYERLSQLLSLSPHRPQSM